jgi:ATP-binding cassette subfamily B protein
VAAFQRIARFWRPYRLLGLGLAGTMVLRAVFAVVLALAIKIVVDQVIEPSEAGLGPYVIVFLVGGYLISLGAGLVGARLTSKATADIVADVRLVAFAHLQTLPLAFHDRTAVGDLIGHFSSDISQLSRGVIQKPLLGLRAVVAMVIYLSVMFLMDWRMALVAAVAFPMVIYFVFRFAPESASSLDEEKQRIADVLDEVSSNLDSQKVLRAFSIRKRSEQRFAERVSILRGASEAAEWKIALEQAIAEYAIELVKLLVIMIGAVFAFNGSLDAGTFAAFAAILTAFSYQASVLGMDVLPSIKQSEAGIRRIDALLETEPLPSSKLRSPVPGLSGRISFDEVTFRYGHDTEPQLDGLSLELPPQSYVAIVGPNGSGKSTILNVLLDLYHIESGMVSVDNVDLAGVDTDEMRRRIGVAFEDTHIFDATILENITLGDDGYSADALETAVDDSGLRSVIDKVPGGLQCTIGPSGFTLSSGESQRVGIARALLRSPELLLLDEVATALDPESEAELTQAIEHLRSGRSVVSVTHRLGAVTGADLIVVVVNGNVSELGTFEELLQSNGVFSAMWKKQSGFDVSANGSTARVHPDRLREIPLFADLNDGTLTNVADAFDSQLLLPGDVVFREGEQGDAFFVIARGVVEIVGALGRPDEDVVAYLEDGDFFGEMALIWDQRRNASVRVRAPTTLLRLNRSAFEDLMRAAPEASEIIRAEAEVRAAENENTTPLVPGSQA